MTEIMKNMWADFFSESPLCCPLCGNTKASVYETLNHYDIKLTYLICNHCRLVYQSPRIPENKVEEFYESQYRLLYLGQTAPRNQELEVQRKRAVNLANFVSDHKITPHNHLDIGCGSGALLYETRSRFNCRVSGIELDKAHREFIAQNEIAVYESLGKWQNYESDKVDLLSLSHVLEHLIDPVAYLVNLRQAIMLSESWLLIEVPNLYVHPALEIAHPFAFSLTTLRNTLNKAGFELSAYKFHSIPRQQLLSLYITALARPCVEAMRKSIQPDRYSRQRRKLGRSLLRTENLSRQALRRLGSKIRSVGGKSDE